jgi:hypothetical protein
MMNDFLPKGLISDSFHVGNKRFLPTHFILDKAGDVILVKGSHGSKMSAIVKLLKMSKTTLA